MLRASFVAHLVAGTCVLASAVGLPASATAQEASLEQIEEARQAYETGSASYRAGDFAGAERSFLHVHDLLHSPGVLYDVALCQEKQHKWGEAADTFTAFLRDSHRAAHRRRLESRVAELRHRTIRQAELSAREPAGRDERRRGGEMAPLPELQLGAGESAQPDRETDEQPAAPPAAPRKSHRLAWALAGSGAVVVAVGLGVGLGLGLRPAGPTPATWDIGPALQSALVSF